MISISCTHLCFVNFLAIQNNDDFYRLTLNYLFLLGVGDTNMGSPLRKAGFINYIHLGTQNMMSRRWFCFHVSLHSPQSVVGWLADSSRPYLLFVSALCLMTIHGRGANPYTRSGVPAFRGDPFRFCHSTLSFEHHGSFAMFGSFCFVRCTLALGGGCRACSSSSDLARSSRPPVFTSSLLLLLLCYLPILFFFFFA